MTEDLLCIPDFLRATKGKHTSMPVTTTKKALHIPPSPYAKKPPKRRALIGAGLCDIYLKMRCLEQGLVIGYYGSEDLESGHTSQICMEHLEEC